MGLAQHLIELRKRLMIAALALVVGVVFAFFVSDLVISIISEPIRVIAEDGDDPTKVALNFTTVTSGFDMRMRIAIAAGILASAPIWMWQAWAFVMPGLTRKEVRYTAGFLGAAIPLFFAGAWLGLVTMPHIVEIMNTFVPDHAASFYDAVYYYDFVFKLLIVFGVSFVLPVFLVALNLAGVITGKAILRGWRAAVLVAVLFAAVATPAADVMSMLLLAGVLTLLFFAAAGLSLIVDRRRRTKDALDS